MLTRREVLASGIGAVLAALFGKRATTPLEVSEPIDPPLTGWTGNSYIINGTTAVPLATGYTITVGDYHTSCNVANCFICRYHA